MEAIEIHEKALDKIRDPSRWTQGQFARDVNQDPVIPDGGDAVCWCSAGAIFAVTNCVRTPEVQTLMDALNRAAFELTGDIDTYVNFNDRNCHDWGPPPPVDTGRRDPEELQEMKIYQVGGAVRDRMMGIEPKDIDYVVVGSTPEEMISLGFKKVGADFPVFLHPDTGAEYALARTERKTANGYHGFDTRFDPGVTIEEDLARRDLTVNAMAQDLQGNIIDPFGGRSDLENKIFSHVSDAFREDPVRVLRVARMCARHPDFSIATSTMVLMRQMAAYGEVDSLTPERVWKEFERALGETRPHKFLEVLFSAHALHIVLPGLEYAAASFLKHARLVANYTPLLGFAACFSGLDEVQARILCKKLKVPTEYRDLAVLFTAFAEKVSCLDMMEPEDAYQLLLAMDTFRKPERIKQMRFLLFVFTEVQFGKSSWSAGSRLELAHGAAAPVRLTEKEHRLSSGLEIKAMLDIKRIEAIRKVW